MKKIIPLFTLTLILHLSLHAAVPVPWTVDMRRAQPATFEAYQGETLDFKASLTLDGKPFEAPSNYSFFWQTNGMGNLYWEAPQQGGAGVPPAQSNVLFATWLPSYDVGARVYNCFIGSPSNNYHTAFQLRLRPSPGADPNTLPLPVPVIDFAKVRVLNPPWSGGGGGGVDTNAVRDIVREQLATNGIRSVDGAARPLPKYLHLYNADDSYPDAAAEYYRQRGSGVPAASCSSVRSGGFLYRNFDYPFDDRAEFVVKMSAGKDRFASVGVAQVGTNLTEAIVTSGKPEYSRLYKWLPGATVDGINENGVACNINVVDGTPQWEGGALPALHPFAAIRWILDNATNAQHAAEYIASHIRFPPGWTQNFHYMIADAEKTYIVENGFANPAGWDQPPSPVMTNFPLFDGIQVGAGQERYEILLNHGNITNAWYTRAYRPDTTPPWVSEFDGDLAALALATNYWALATKEAHRGESFNGTNWWQTVHTSVYDLTNRVLRVAVQETDDWYVFQVPSSGAKVDAYTKSETDAKLAGKLSDRPSGNGWGSPLVYWDSEGGLHFAPSTVDFHAATVEATDFKDMTGGLLSAKANRPVNFDSSHAGNLAALNENGDLADSHVGTDERGIKIEASGGIVSVQLNDGGVYIESLLPGAGDVTVVDNSSCQSVRHDLSAKADRSMISATDPTFSNAVLSVGISTNVLATVQEIQSLGTNTVHQIADFVSAFDGIGITLPQGGVTLAGLLAALVAAVTWLKRTLGKVVDNSAKPTDDFATDLLGKPVAKEAIDNRTKASASAITGDALTLPDGGVVSASSSAPTITFGTARQDGLRFCELYITNPDTANDGSIASISGKVYSDISLTDLPKLDKGATYYFTFAEFKVDNGVSWWKVSKQKLDAIGGDIPTPTAA